MCRVQWQSIGGDGTLGGDNEEAGFNIIPPTNQPANPPTRQQPTPKSFSPSEKHNLLAANIALISDKSFGLQWRSYAVTTIFCSCFSLKDLGYEVRNFFQPQIFIFQEEELVLLGMCSSFFKYFKKSDFFLGLWHMCWSDKIWESGYWNLVLIEEQIQQQQKRIRFKWFL